MHSISSIALSCLNAASLSLNASANNVANALTPGYRREQVVQQSDADGGVSAALRQLPESEENLADDIVSQRAASYVFKANLRVIQTSDRVLGALLDAFA
jgi:flagellar hook-associated protein FlgK